MYRCKVKMVYSGGEKMAKNLEFGALLDLYGSLISEKQSEAMDYYYNQDLSLSEIGELLNISRQAVRNNIKKGEENILDFENRLGLYKKLEKVNVKIENAAKKLRKINKELGNEKIEAIAKELSGIELV